MTGLDPKTLRWLRYIARNPDNKRLAKKKAKPSKAIIPALPIDSDADDRVSELMAEAHKGDSE